MKIVVTTPTGNVGSRVTRLLLQAGVRPTVLLRDPAGLDEQTRAHVDAVAYDLLDPDVAAVVSRATGRPLRAEQIPDDEMRGALRAAGLGDIQVEAFLGMSAGLREDFVPEDPDDPHDDPDHARRLGAPAHLSAGPRAHA